VDGNSTNLSTAAAASGTISALRGPFLSDVADVNSTDGQLDIRGAPQAACQGY
jgi:hypothetical protein